jgi:hypothetical protein
MKKLLLVSCSLLIVFASYAQHIEFSARLNLTASYLTFSDVTQVHYVESAYHPSYAYRIWDAYAFNSAMRPAYEAGIDMKVKLINRLYFRTGLNLQMLRHTFSINDSYRVYYGSDPSKPREDWPGSDNKKPIDADNIRRSMLYTSLPLLLEYNISKKLNIFAGPQVAVLVRATTTRDVLYEEYNPNQNEPAPRPGEVSTINRRWTETVKEKDRKDYSIWQLAAKMGAQYNLSRELGIEFSYLRGLNDLYPDRLSLHKTKMNAYTMGISYKFQ